MPNIKSAKKRVLLTEKRNSKNASQKSALRTSIKKARVAVEAKEETAAAAVKTASINLDKAASKGLIHKNNAARKKARLAKALNKAQ